MKLWLDVPRGIQNRGYLERPVHHMEDTCINYYNKYSSINNYTIILIFNLK